MRAAIVDADGIAGFLPAALARHGVESVHVRSDTPNARLVSRPSGLAAEVRYRGDVPATAAALRECGVDIVVAGTESGVLLADALSAELGTPGNGMTRPAARRDKHEMAEAVRAAGLANAASLATGSADELVAWARRLGEWPVVVKPLASSGAEQVFFCRSEAEIRAAHAAVLATVTKYGTRNTAVLGQQYLHGQEFFVNTVSRAGVHHVVEVWRYHKRPVTGDRLMYDYEWPLPVGAPAAHTEVMLTAAGPVLVECGARAGGSHKPSIVSGCLGTDQIDCLALVIARPEELVEGRLVRQDPRSHLRYVTLINPRDGGRIGRHPPAPVRALGSFLDMVVTAPAGRPLPRTVDLATSPGYVYLDSPDPDEVEADYRRLRRLEQDGLYTEQPEKEGVIYR